ncbi:MAG: hypothetical protein KF833_12400 [Verrucomicrobiae bacterium]|nr:hypothetical protein [Verrucomicrobiae bacterium]
MKSADLSPRRRRAFSHGIVGVVALISASPLAVAQFVEVTAEIEGFHWPASSAASLSTSWTVRCVVGSGSWRMDTAVGSSSTNSVWFLGDHVIQVSQDPGIPGGFVARRWNSADGSPGRPQGPCYRLSPQTHIAWLAFGSVPFLNNPDRAWSPLESSGLMMAYAPSGFRDRIEVFEDALGLPKAVTLYADSPQPILQYRVTRSTRFSAWDLPPRLAPRDFQDAFPVARSLKSDSDPLAVHLRDRVTGTTRAMLHHWDATTAPSGELRSCLLTDLNGIIEGPSIWDDLRFSDIPLRDETLELLDADPIPASRARLNRLLLEDAYPEAFFDRRWVIPLEFQLVQYRPAWSPAQGRYTADAWEVEIVAKGRVTSIARGTEPTVPEEYRHLLENTLSARANIRVTP